MENSNNFSAGESLSENAFMANEQERNIDEKEKLRVEVQQDLGEKTILSVNLKDGLNVKYEESNDHLEKEAKLREEAIEAYNRQVEENANFAKVGTKLAILSTFNKVFAGPKGKKVLGAFLGLVVMSNILAACAGSHSAANVKVSSAANDQIGQELKKDGDEPNLAVDEQQLIDGTQSGDNGSDLKPEAQADIEAKMLEREVEYSCVSKDEGEINVSYSTRDVNAEALSGTMTAEVREALSEELSPDRLVPGENYNKGKLATEEGQYIGFNAVSTKMYTNGEQLSDDDLVDRFAETVANEYTASAEYVMMLDLNDLHNLNASRDIIEIFERDAGTNNLYERLVNYGRLSPTCMDELTRLGEAAVRSIFENSKIDIEDIKNTERFSPYLHRDVDGGVVKGAFGKARGGNRTIKAIILSGENAVKQRYNYIINTGLADEMGMKKGEDGSYILDSSTIPEVDLSLECSQPTVSAGNEAEPTAGAGEFEWTSAAGGEDEPSAAGDEGSGTAGNEGSGTAGNETEWGKGDTPWHFESGTGVDTSAGPTEKPKDPTFTETTVEATPINIQDTSPSADWWTIDTSSDQDTQTGSGGNAEEQGEPTQYSSGSDAGYIQQSTTVGDGHHDDSGSSQQGQGSTPPVDTGSTPFTGGSDGGFNPEDWDF
jgi:hypothetical protein